MTVIDTNSFLFFSLATYICLNAKFISILHIMLCTVRSSKIGFQHKKKLLDHFSEEIRWFERFHQANFEAQRHH